MSVVVTRSSPEGRRSWPVIRRSKVTMSSPSRLASSTICSPQAGQRIAAAAALEQARAQVLLDLAEPAEHRGVIDAELLGRAGERTAVGDRLDVAEIVPGQHLGFARPCLRICKARPQPQPVSVEKSKWASGPSAAGISKRLALWHSVPGQHASLAGYGARSFSPKSCDQSRKGAGKPAPFC